MAEKLTPTAEVKGVSPDDLRKAVAEISRQKTLASEYAGNAGKATANAVERFGLEKTALTFARRLSDVEEGKRAAIVRSSLEYWWKLGFFAQLDAFDDVANTLQQILDDIRSNDNAARPSDGAETLDDLVGED